MIISKSDTYKCFYVEFKHGRNAIRRKCIKCGTMLESNNFGTSCLINFWRRCRKSSPGPSAYQNVIQFPVVKRIRREVYGEDEVANVAISDIILTTKFSESKTLRKWYKRMGFGGVTTHGLNE